MRITKEMVDSLSNPDITKRQYDEIIAYINTRTIYIWESLIKLSKRKLNCFTFSNDVDYADGRSSGGTFDPDEYDEWIEIVGEFSYIHDKYYEYNTGFPTKFLWMDDADWKNEVLTNIKESKELEESEKRKTKESREAKKIKSKEMREIILGKLTKEELKYIKFK